MGDRNDSDNHREQARHSPPVPPGHDVMEKEAHHRKSLAVGHRDLRLSRCGDGKYRDTHREVTGLRPTSLSLDR
jgi:hypothetical protein